MANLQIINDLVKKKNLTKKEFCQRVGVAEQSLREIIARNSVRTDILERIAKELEVPVGTFFGECGGLVVTGKNNQINQGVGNQILQSQEKEIDHLNELICEKNKIIVEKERVIQLLLKNQKND